MLSPTKLFSTFRDIKKRGKAELFKLLLVEAGASWPAPLREELSRGSRPGALALVVQEALSSEPGKATLTDADGLLIACGEQFPPDDFMRSLRRAGHPFLVVSFAPVSPQRRTAAMEAGLGDSDWISLDRASYPLAKLARSFVEKIPEEKALHLAGSLPVFRSSVAHEVVRKTAKQNGVIGAIFFMPGTDMPAMSLNQVKMVLELAALYDCEIGRERALEIAGVLGAGVGMRLIARQLVGLLPGPGFILKGGVAYAGTLAMGQAAIAYFEGGAPADISKIGGLINRAKESK